MVDLQGRFGYRNAMRRTILIASTEDPAATVELLDALAREEPTKVVIYSMLEGEGSGPIGHCVRFWRKEGELWAELEVSDGSYWPGPHDPLPAPLIAECIIGYRTDEPDLIGVVISAMPRGMLRKLLEQTMDRASKAN